MANEGEARRRDVDGDTAIFNPKAEESARSR
jgi:hypothetical protein